MGLFNKKQTLRDELFERLKDEFYEFALSKLNCSTERDADAVLEPQFSVSRFKQDGRNGLFFEIIANIADDKCDALDKALTAVVQEYDEDAFFTTDGMSHNAYVFEDKAIKESMDKNSIDPAADREPQPERKPLTEGPGAGYSIKCKGYRVESADKGAVKVSDFGENAKKLEFDCKVIGTVDSISAQSYYYSADIEDSDSADLRRFEINEILTIVPNDIYEGEDDAFQAALDELDDSDIVYGGGWSHSTYDGTILEFEDLSRFYEPENFGATMYSGRLTNQETIDFIDKAVQGENIDVLYTIEVDDVEEWDSGWCDSDADLDDEMRAVAKEILKEEPDAEVKSFRYEEFYDINGEPIHNFDTYKVQLHNYSLGEDGKLLVEFLDFGKKSLVDKVKINLGNQPLSNGINVLNGNNDMLSGDMNGLHNTKGLGAAADAGDADLDEFLDFGKKSVVDEIEIDLGNQPLANGANILNGNQDTLSGDMNGL